MLSQKALKGCQNNSSGKLTKFTKTVSFKEKCQFFGWRACSLSIPCHPSHYSAGIPVCQIENESKQGALGLEGREWRTAAWRGGRPDQRTAPAGWAGRAAAAAQPTTAGQPQLLINIIQQWWRPSAARPAVLPGHCRTTTL